jgi:hypothetical protein
LQIAAGEDACVFDVLELSKAGQIFRLSVLLKDVLCSTTIVKVMHDLGPVVHILSKVRGQHQIFYFFKRMNTAGYGP